MSAAQINYIPNGITIDAEPGEAVIVPVSVSLSATTLPNYYASFGLVPNGGTLDQSWISRTYVSLNSWYRTRQVFLRVSPPVDAAAGSYSVVLSPTWLRSNESITPDELTLYINVNSDQVSCSHLPEFSAISSSEEKIPGRNNKPVTIELSGSVTLQDNCQLESFYYALVDEYGELNIEEDITVATDGTFNTPVTMIASRKGSDKDGRHYKIKFFAENQAGTGESAETVFVVEHDQRKK